MLSTFDELEQELYEDQLSEWDEEIIGKKDNRKPVRNTTQVPYRWICQLRAGNRNRHETVRRVSRAR